MSWWGWLAVVWLGGSAVFLLWAWLMDWLRTQQEARAGVRQIEEFLGR